MRWLLILALMPVMVFAMEEDPPIVVCLESDTKLLSLYIAPFVDASSGLTKDYLQKLQQVLKFDFNYNGMTYLSKSTTQAKEGSWDLPGEFSKWASKGVYYVLRGKVQNKQLYVKLDIVNSQETKLMEAIALNGNLEVDRRKIHLLADTIYKALFQEDGIALTKILYTVKKQDPISKKWISEVCEADWDGGNFRQVTHDGGYCVTPSCIAPKAGMKSSNFVVVSYKIGQPKIYISQIEKGEMQRLSLLKGNQLMPTISRQRDKIAFISDVTGNPDLFLQDFDKDKGLLGKPRQIFTSPGATQGTPTFSPDGKKIAFVSDRDGTPRIYVMEIPKEGALLKNVQLKLISKLNRENTAPSWSMDGKKIAYCAMTKGVRQIWVYDFETGRERQLTQGSGNKENPSWAPNSLHIIFNLTQNNTSELYLINLNQKEAVKISAGEGEKRFPSWEMR